MPEWLPAVSEIGAGIALVYLIYVMDRQQQRQQETEQKRTEVLAEIMRDVIGAQRREGE